MLAAAPAALAQDATWLTNPGTSEFNTAANWTPATVPLGTATFGSSATTTLTLTFVGTVNLGAFQFNAGAPAYTFDFTSAAGSGIRFNGAGIVNNSSNAPTFNVGDHPLFFNNASSAGNAIINVDNGVIGFFANSTPGAAQLNTTTAFGGVDFSATSGPAGDNKISAGSIAGPGTFYLGSNELTVGGNNLSTEVSGAISDCGFGGTNCFTTPSGPGSLVKVGTGTLTLSGPNFYSGGTTISGGTVTAAHLDGSGNIDALGTGNVILNGGTLKAGVSGILQNAITFNDNKTSTVSAGAQALELSNAISLGTNSTAQFGVAGDTGTVILSGAGGSVDPTAALVVAGGTLKEKDGGSGAIAGLTFFTASTTVNTGATLDFNDSSNQAIRNLTGSGSVVTGTVGETSLTLYVDDSTSSTFGGVISGPGSVTVQTYNGGTGGKMILTGANTWTGGTTICDCATLQLGTSVTPGSIAGAVTNEGTFDIVNANTAGITTVTNQAGAYTIFRNSTGAGTMTIDNQSGGSVEFRQTSSAANAVINNSIFASTTFFNSSSAGSATINNVAGSGIAVVEFNTLSKAGSATINNAGFSWVVFNDRTTLENAKIVNSDNGLVLFNSQSNAGSATASISNNDQGEVHFLDRSKAGFATITNNDFAALDFNNRASADNATIINSSAFGMDFFDQSTAGNAFITTRNNSGTFFSNRSDGGTARFETEAGSVVDFSGSRGPNADGKISAGSIAGAGDYFIGGGNTLSVGGNNLSTEVSGVIADSCGCSPGSGALAKVGTGTLILSGTNTYSGGTTITAGTLQLGNGTATGSIPGDVVNNATLAFNRSNAYQFDGAISGNGVVQQNGAGTTTLTAVNSYGGGTVINAGKLSVSADANLGASTGALTFNGGTLQFTNHAALTLSGPRAITLQGGGGGFELTDGNVTVNQAIGGSGALGKSGSGLLLLAGNNSYTGATTISAGTLALSGTGSIAASSGVVDNATFDISATTAGASIKNLSGTGVVTLGSQTLTLTNASGTFAGAIGGDGGLIKQGAGLFTLSGANTFLGGTTVADGNLRVNGSVASPVNVQSGATLSGTGSVGGLVTIQSGGTLSAGHSPGTLTVGALNLNAGSTTIFELGSPGVVGGASNDLVDVTGNLMLGGTLSVNAPSAGYYRLFNYGTLTASSFDTINGSSNGTPTVLTNVPNQVNLLIAGAGQRIQFWDGADQTGNGVVNGGTGSWNAANTNWTGAPGQAGINDQWRSSVGVFAGTAGTVTVAGTQAFDTLQFSTTGYLLNAGAGGQLLLAGAGTGTINTDNGVTATINTPIVNGGAQSLTKVGGGTLILTAANSYTGGTMISGGTLQLGNGSTAGSITGNVTDNGVFAIDRSDAFTFSGKISGSGALQQTGTGTTILTADNNYTGGTMISAGTLQLGNGGTTGSIVGNVLNNGVLAINRSNAVTLGGAISGTGSLQQTGSGTMTLGGANTYTGATTISNGALTIAAGGSITSDVTNNATFNNSGSVAGGVTNSGTFNNNAGGIVSGLLTNTGTTTNAGQLNGGANVSGGTLTNNNLVSGDVTISGGALASTGHVINNLTITGAVTNAGVFDNNANATVSGLLTNSAGTASNAGQLNGGALVSGGTLTNAGQLIGGANVTGGILTNNNVVSGEVRISGGSSVATGRVDNNLTITGAVTNAGVFNNNATGSLSGLLTNTGLSGVTTNAGQLKGGASILGGTLITTGTIANGLVNNATVNANGGAINGAVVNNANGMFNVAGTVTGDGSFTNNPASGSLATAVLAIGAGGIYTLQGTLTNSGVVTVAGGGQLIATLGGITNNAGGTITVAPGGTVKDDLTNAGAIANSGTWIANIASNTGAGSITNAATGSWSGNILSNAASITNNGGWTGNVASSTGTIDNNGTWTGTVSNAGTFNNNAGATVSGLLTTSAGTTLNNGALNGGASVSGGTLAGSGTVTNLSVSGGIFSPGNGTPGSSMTITGNLAFQSGALYLVQLNPATSTFASIAGAATLNGGAGAAFLAGNYVARQYTILTAAGGVSGTFGSFATFNIPSGFRASLSYGANDVFLNLDLALARYSGLTVNQQNVANALTNFFNASGGIPAVFGTLTPQGLTQVSGELATASQQTTFDAMNLFLGLLTDPFVAGRGEPVASPAPAPQFAEEGDVSAYASNRKPRSRRERDAYEAVYRKAPVADSFTQRWSVWAAGYGGSQTTDGNVVVGSNNTRSSIGGVAVGADYRFSPVTLAGFAIAGGGTGFSVNGLGTGRSDLFQAGAFVRHNNGPAYISAALAYGWQDITTDRTVAIAGADLLRARFNANAFSGRVEGGYRFVTPWIAMGLTPYAAGQFTTFDLPAYAEQPIAGASTFALAYGAKDVTASRSELGLRSDRSFAVENGIFTLRGRAAWAHNFNPDRTIAATFQTLPGASFVVGGAAQAADSALVTGSAEMKWLNGVSLAATFEGEFSGVTRAYAGKGVARYAW